MSKYSNANKLRVFSTTPISAHSDGRLTASVRRASVAYVSNGGWLDGMCYGRVSALSWQKSFSSHLLFQSAGECSGLQVSSRRKEKGNDFWFREPGHELTIAILFLVKKKNAHRVNVKSGITTSAITLTGNRNWTPSVSSRQYREHSGPLAGHFAE